MRPRSLPCAVALAAVALAAVAAALPLGAQGARAAAPADALRPDPLAAPYLEAMTWTEIRDAIAAGSRAVIVPTGGTEQNGPHMVLGKHNYIVTFAAGVLAQRLGNTLVAPTIQYVPEGDYTRPGFGAKPGVISLPGPAYERLLDAAVRSLRVHGFTDILLIGDSGGNQAGLTAVSNALNAEWAGSGVRVHALVDYYQQGRVLLRDYLKRTYGWDEATVGSHAGTTDTSQLLYVYPQGIRTDRLAPGGGSPDSGVSGDPTKASAAIGQMAIDLKVNAAVAQYRALKGGGAP
ncbi:MAG: creatininase family protein [Gemmatimonadetes bacterium]|nr:creatininase family protein [Gemmatimonadota bacterium]